jgi:hypothetical protein
MEVGTLNFPLLQQILQHLVGIIEKNGSEYCPSYLNNRKV